MWRKILSVPVARGMTGDKKADLARDLCFTMFEHNGTIYAVPVMGIVWDQYPLFEVDYLGS